MTPTMSAGLADYFGMWSGTLSQLSSASMTGTNSLPATAHAMQVQILDGCNEASSWMVAMRPDEDVVGLCSCVPEESVLADVLHKHTKPQRRGFKDDEKLQAYVDLGAQGLTVLMRRPRCQVRPSVGRPKLQPSLAAWGGLATMS